MFDSIFEKDATGTLKALTLEWVCPKCDGRNFRILSRGERRAGEYHGRCRYCHTRCRAAFSPQETPVEGEDEFMERIDLEDFTDEERTDMIRDFAEIASLNVDRVPPQELRERRKLLEEKIAFAKRRRH
jgi:hypothetical protein